MKITSILIIILVALSATARIISDFPGWDRLIAFSQYIAVVQCGDPRPPIPTLEDAPKSDSDIQIVYTLKGTNSVRSPHLLTDHELSTGKVYLVFGHFEGEEFRAFEEFHVVPLNCFSTNGLVTAMAGLTVDEQLQELLKNGLDKANRHLKSAQEEKQRLEEWVK